MSKKIFPFLLFLSACVHSGQKPFLSSFQNVSPTSYEVKEMNVDNATEFQSSVKTVENYLIELLRPTIDPYYAKPDKDDRCYAEFIQSRRQHSTDVVDVTEYQLRSTASFQFGLCHEEKDIYNAKIYFVYCKSQQKGLQIKIFWPKNVQANWNLNHYELCK